MYIQNIYHRELSRARHDSKKVEVAPVSTRDHQFSIASFKKNMIKLMFRNGSTVQEPLLKEKAL